MSRSKHTMTLRSFKNSLPQEAAVALVATPVVASTLATSSSSHRAIAISSGHTNNSAPRVDATTILQTDALPAHAKGDTPSDSDSDSDTDSGSDYDRAEGMSVQQAARAIPPEAPKRAAIYLTQREKVLLGVFTGNSLLYNQEIAVAKTANDIGWTYWKTLEYFTSLVQKLDVNNTYVNPVAPNTPQTPLFDPNPALSLHADSKRKRPSEETLDEPQNKRLKVVQSSRVTVTGNVPASVAYLATPVSADSGLDESRARLLGGTSFRNNHSLTAGHLEQITATSHSSDIPNQEEKRDVAKQSGPTEEQENCYSHQLMLENPDGSDSEEDVDTVKRSWFEEHAENDKYEDDYDFNHGCVLQ